MTAAISYTHAVCALSVFHNILLSTTVGDQFGWSVDMSDDGSGVIVGAFLNDGAATNSGHSHLCEFDGSDWKQIGDDIDGEFSRNFSGSSVAVSDDGKNVINGEPCNDDGGTDSG